MAQNLNLLITSPLFSQRKKGQNLGQFHFSKISAIFAIKGVKCYLIQVLRPDLESSRRFTFIRPQYGEILETVFFGSS